MMSKSKAKIELNNFYKIYGGPSHTSFVYKKDKNRKTYYSIKFGTTKNKDMFEIKPINSKGDLKYVHNRPYEGKRSDYGDKSLKGLAIHPSDYSFIDKIKKRKPHKTAKVKKYYP